MIIFSKLNNFHQFEDFETVDCDIVDGIVSLKNPRNLLPRNRRYRQQRRLRRSGNRASVYSSSNNSNDDNKTFFHRLCPILEESHVDDYHHATTPPIPEHKSRRMPRILADLVEGQQLYYGTMDSANVGQPRDPKHQPKPTTTLSNAVIPPNAATPTLSSFRSMMYNSLILLCKMAMIIFWWLSSLDAGDHSDRRTDASAFLDSGMY